MKLLTAVLSCLALAQTAQLRYETAVPFRELLQVKNSRIVNGTPATPGQFPYQAFLIGYTADLRAKVCGGSLISNQWILTAAHCITQVVRFEISMGSIAYNHPEQVGHSEYFIVHPNYNGVNNNNDIGVVRLTTPVTFTTNVQPIALPLADRTTETFVGLQATASGFGRTSDAADAEVSKTLNWTYKRTVTNAACQAVFGTSVVIDSVICAVGWGADNQNICSGDSGGPLTIVENNQVVQIGVVSFGAASGCTLAYPSGYMRTTHFRTWIFEKTGV